jgi:hypothetical protein
MSTNKKFKIGDGVWHRVVQIVQEAMLMGVDCVDLMRQVEVCEDPENAGELALTPEYANQVEKMHAAWLVKAEQLQKELEVAGDVSTAKINFDSGVN